MKAFKFLEKNKAIRVRITEERVFTTSKRLENYPKVIGVITVSSVRTAR